MTETPCRYDSKHRWFLLTQRSHSASFFPFRFLLTNTIWHLLALVFSIGIYIHTKLKGYTFDYSRNFMLTAFNQFWINRLLRYCEGVIMYHIICFIFPMVTLSFLEDDNAQLMNSNVKVRCIFRNQRCHVFEPPLL
jgi:hypothetical protein